VSLIYTRIGLLKGWVNSLRHFWVNCTPLLIREPSERKLCVLRREIACCWRKYEARNNDLAHLAANILILLATVWEAELIAGESLKSMKSESRGRGAKGRWVNWRTNTQIRGALWRTLRYKCHLSGLHLVWQYPRGTTHTCPHCVTPVKGHHLSEEQSPTSSGNGSMPNVSLTPEREVKDQSMTRRSGRARVPANRSVSQGNLDMVKARLL